VGLRDRIRQDPARAARQGLLGVVLLVSAAVAWSLLRPAPKATLPSAPVAASGTTVGDMAFLRFRDDSRKIELKAREMVRGEGDVMQMRGVVATLPFVSQGRPATATIRADECQYQPGLERAAFKGNVQLRTDDGFELDSDTLKYWGDKERAFSPNPVRFKRGALSGTALALEYDASAGVLIKGDVRVRIENAAGPPTDVTSHSATASREEHFVNFQDAVVVREGARELKSASLRLEMSEELDVVERAIAVGDVDLVSGAGEPLPGAAPSGGGKRLRSQRLEVVFRTKGILQEAVATGAALLEIEPAPSEAKERRRISGPQLRFDFDAEGRLLSVGAPRGTSAGTPARDRSLLTSEPLTPGAGVARRVESDSFVAALDAATGAVKNAVFEGSVAFEEPGRKAWAGHSTFDVAAGSLVLTRDPRILDEAEGSELRGKEIRIGTRTRAVSASGNVRHSLPGKGRGGRAGPFGGNEPTVFLCRDFEFDPQTRTARYQENALARSGTDEVRAPLITIDEPGPGKRRMSASGGTTSVLHPRPAKGTTKAPAAVEARSREMQYEQEKNRIVYQGDVEIRQGDILTRSPEAIVLLTQDGETVDRLLAGEPVEVHQGVRRATGERGAYTPASETFVLTGEQVVLYDVDRRLEGRILTFEVGSDRIRVDGREEVRTEAVFRRKQAPQP